MQQSTPNLEGRIQKIVRKMLGSGVSKEQPLMEAGLDSLGAVELRTSLQAEFSVELPATLVFDFPSVAAISKFIASQQSPPVATLQPTPAVSIPLHLRFRTFIHVSHLETYLHSAHQIFCSKQLQLSGSAQIQSSDLHTVHVKYGFLKLGGWDLQCRH